MLSAGCSPLQTTRRAGWRGRYDDRERSRGRLGRVHRRRPLNALLILDFPRIVGLLHIVPFATHGGFGVVIDAYEDTGISIISDIRILKEDRKSAVSTSCRSD